MLRVPPGTSIYFLDMSIDTILYNKSQNYKNVSLKNDIEFSNTDIEKLNKVTYYDNKLYNYFKNS